MPQRDGLDPLPLKLEPLNPEPSRPQSEDRSSCHYPKRGRAVQMSASMKEKQNGQLGKVAECIIGKRATALVRREKIAPQKILHLVSEGRHRERKCQFLQICMTEEGTRCLQSDEDENKTE